MPAQRSATARASAATSGVSTGSGLTTLASRSIRPGGRCAATRSSTQPSRRVPAKRTRTRVPGRPRPKRLGDDVVESRSRCGSETSTATRAIGSTSAGPGGGFTFAARDLRDDERELLVAAAAVTGEFYRTGPSVAGRSSAVAR